MRDCRTCTPDFARTVIVQCSPMLPHGRNEALLFIEAHDSNLWRSILPQRRITSNNPPDDCSVSKARTIDIYIFFFG